MKDAVSDIGGNGGNIYLLDYEELKKAMNDATGSTAMKDASSKMIGSSAVPLYKGQKQ